MSNIDPKTVASFGDEWSRFDQTGMSDTEIHKAFEEYFSVFQFNVQRFFNNNNMMTTLKTLNKLSQNKVG